MTICYRLVMRYRYFRDKQARPTTNSSGERSTMAADSKQTRDCSPFMPRRGFSPGTFSLTITTLTIYFGCVCAQAQENTPCAQIRTACAQAGFKAGAAKQGFGLMADCVHPLMQGVPQRAKATRPLPQIDAQLIAACKAANPDFGQRQRAPSPSSGPGGQGPSDKL